MKEGFLSAFTPRKREVVLSTGEKTKLQLGEIEKDEGNVLGVRYFLNLITTNPNNAIGLVRAFQAGKINSQFNTLIDPVTEQELQINGEYIEKKTVEKYKVTAEQAQLLEELAGFLESSGVSSELKGNLKRFVQTTDAAALSRMEAIMTMNQDGQLEEKINTWSKGFSAEKSRLDLENEFFNRLVKKESLAELFEFLGVFQEKDDKDRVLVNRLQARAVFESRFNTILACIKGFKSPFFDESLNLLAPLVSSPIEGDRETARVVVKVLYTLELAEYRSTVLGRLDGKFTPDQIRTTLTSLPERAPVDDIDHVKTYAEMREKTQRQLLLLNEINRIEAATQIRKKFKTSSPEDILKRINDLSGETMEDLAIKRELITLYRAYVAAEKPEIFDERFGKEILAQIEAELKQKFISPELGQNKQAFNYIRDNYIRTIFPLIESLRADPTTKEAVAGFLGTSGRAQYEIRLKNLEEQRPLTDTERAYLQSVELLSLFNPYLVAAVYADQAVASEFLKHHFEILSNQTIEELQDGEYVPLIQVGTGPNGLASLGEVVRNNAKLAGAMLVVDGGEQPGGPFAIPGGRAWELNSANRRGANGPTLPETPENSEISELKKVRAYGSPLRWYPGERAEGNTIRQGSINTTVDYLPVPDDLSATSRYPSNEDLQLILALQSAMLVNRMALKTRLVSSEPNFDPNGKGDKLVTLEISQLGREPRRVTLQTDALFISSGLGDPTYGFPLEGTNAERVLDITKNIGGFPKLSTTLEAFKALSSRTAKKESPGKTLAIYGGGNSADVLIEFISSIFQGDNPRVRDVTKIYVITQGELSARPRYAAIADLKPRNGKGNLIEFVKARVQDVGLIFGEGDIKNRPLIFFDTDGEIIENKRGEFIQADSAISAAGFKPKLDEIFAPYLRSEQTFRVKKGEFSPTEPIRLPTNQEVTVAETLKSDPTVVFLGTASNPDFKNEEKLLQLPVDARKALQRNGAENAVAIGFRAPDTQAAVNIWLNQQDIRVTEKTREKRKIVPLEGLVKKGDVMSVPIVAERDTLLIPDNISSENLIMTPLFSYAIGNKIEVQTKEGKGFTGTLDFELDYNIDSWVFRLVFNGGSSDVISSEIENAVKSACEDFDFQRYAVSALSKKRRNRKIDIALSFANGKLNPKETFVQN